MRVIFSWGTNIWPLYGVARWPFFRGSVVSRASLSPTVDERLARETRGSVTVEVYVSSIRTRAFGRYIEDGCCRGVTVMRGSTVSNTAEFIGQRRIIRYLRYTDTLDGGSVAPFS